MVNVPPSSHLAILKKDLPARVRDLDLLLHYLEACNWNSVHVMLEQLKDNTEARQEVQEAKYDVDFREFQIDPLPRSAFCRRLGSLSIILVVD